MHFLTTLFKNQSFLFSFTGGLLYACGFPLFNEKSFFLAPLIGLSFFLFALFIEEKSLKRQLFNSLAFSIGFYFLGFYWIPYTLKEFGGLNFPFNQLLGIIFAFIIVPQFYFFTLIQRKLKNKTLLSLSFVLLEAFIPQQFPAHIGHSFLSLSHEWPLRLAPIFGAPIYSFFTIFLAMSFIEHFKTKKAPLCSYAFMSLLVIANMLLPASPKGAALPKLSLRIVQPNIGNFLKIDSEKGGAHSLSSVFDSYYELSTAPSSQPLDLIIWPETAFPSLIVSEVMRKRDDLKIPGVLSQIITKTQSELFFGGYDIKPSIGVDDYQSQYNSAFHFGRDKKLKDVYRKMRLIPFGEGLPFGPLNRTLSKYLTNVSFFAEGENYTLFETASGISFVSAICYEILFPDFIREFLNHTKKSPQFLINLTNDSWYGNTAEPFQHLFLAKWRALEFNLPIIRSTNTGITTVIFPDGSESKRLTYQETKSLDLTLELHERKPTIYQKFGLWMMITLAISLYLLELIYKKIKT